MTDDGNGSEPEVSGRSPMSGTRQPDDLAALAEKQQLAGRHHAALDSLRESDRATADRTCGASTGATQRMTAQISALAASVTATAPDKGRRVRVPTASGGLEPVHDVLR